MEKLPEQDWHALALKAAADSPCQKRKVGAVVVDDDNSYVIGNNHHPHGFSCELEDGTTRPEVVHAEISAIQSYAKVHGRLLQNATIYVTHKPCDNCQRAIDNEGITKVVIVEEFMKFDKDKLRYELIPPSALLALAKVLSYGAKKYKPGNWRGVDDPDRYIGAAMRHCELYRQGEEIDPESGLPHLAHAMTNLAFLHELQVVPGEENDSKET